jgi:hypothetical protein
VFYRASRELSCGWAAKEARIFFFEKKKQKTFVMVTNWGQNIRRAKRLGVG